MSKEFAGYTVIGSGSREHAIVWKLLRSGLVTKVYALPGNPGIARQAECMSVDTGELVDIYDACSENQSSLVVVGPEAPLCRGVIDLLEGGMMSSIGPVAEAAQLEGSKIWAKRFMNRHGIRTAGFRIFYDAGHANKYVADRGDIPLVIKADGLAGGKGVVVASNSAEAHAAIDQICRLYGERLVIEEKLSGTECSFTVLVRKDGDVFVLPTAVDYKRLHDGDTGPNTGGMGGYAPYPRVASDQYYSVMRDVVLPTLKGLQSEHIQYHGFLSVGLMFTAYGPMVLEYNVRLGDPEACLILPLLDDQKHNFARLLEMVGEKDPRGQQLWSENKKAVAVVLASKNYPEGSCSVSPALITGIEEAEQAGALVFHAGTSLLNGELCAYGGRILTVVGVGDTYAEAREKAYVGVGCIHFDGMHYRTDIAKGL